MAPAPFAVGKITLSYAEGEYWSENFLSDNSNNLKETVAL